MKALFWIEMLLLEWPLMARSHQDFEGEVDGLRQGLT